MGLDITAVSKIKPVDGCNADDCMAGNHITLYKIDGVADRAPEVAEGHYEYEGETFGFHAGSYSGYNYWRETLCRLMLNVAPSVVWNSPDRFDGKPFVELINFSDCEGTIGPSIAKKLAADFMQYANVAANCGEPFFAEKYAEWMKALEIASDNGAVCFH